MTTDLLAYRVNQDARTAWMRRLDAPDAPEPVPAPEVGARLARQSDPVPRAATELAHRAKALGWAVLVVYSRGTVLGAKGQVLRIADAVSVRVWRFPEERAVALWLDGSAEGGWFWSGGRPTIPGFRNVGVAAVKTYITGGTEEATEAVLATASPKAKAVCTGCGATVTINKDGSLRTHGPRNARCEGR